MTAIAPSRVNLFQSLTLSCKRSLNKLFAIELHVNVIVKEHQEVRLHPSGEQVYLTQGFSNIHFKSKTTVSGHSKSQSLAFDQ